MKVDMSICQMMCCNEDDRWFNVVDEDCDECLMSIWWCPHRNASYPCITLIHIIKTYTHRFHKIQTSRCMACYHSDMEKIKFIVGTNSRSQHWGKAKPLLSERLKWLVPLYLCYASVELVKLNEPNFCNGNQWKQFVVKNRYGSLKINYVRWCRLNETLIPHGVNKYCWFITLEFVQSHFEYILELPCYLNHNTEIYHPRYSIQLMNN